MSTQTGVDDATTTDDRSWSAKLIEYYRKLDDGGLPPSLIELIVYDAARRLHDGDLRV